jgi:FAD:protein FMN transferase
MAAKINRRRFIRITGIAAGLGFGLTPDVLSHAAAAPLLHRWSGIALGGDASLLLYHPDAATAARLIKQCLAEVRRLEKVFSLYDRSSALCRLNRDGRLPDPPPELVELLGSAEQFSRASGGAFDATVQPLWNLYAAHFSTGNADTAGPPAAAVTAALARVGHAAVSVAPDLIRFERPDMGVTLNGIAQGYITDGVAELLRAEGIDHTLVDMGEMRALGGHPAGRPWQVGLQDPRQEDGVLRTLPLADQAIATSGGYGTQFDATGRFNHLFDPHSGGCSDRYLSVSVMAPTTTMANALSVAFSLMPLDRTAAVLRSVGATAAWFVQRDGSILVQRA